MNAEIVTLAQRLLPRKSRPLLKRRGLFLGAAILLVMAAIAWQALRGWPELVALTGEATRMPPAPAAGDITRVHPAVTRVHPAVTGSHSAQEPVARNAVEVTKSSRLVAGTNWAALFATRSWHVDPPPPPLPPPPPPPVPTAPAFPFTFVGAYAPEGDPTVYFLAHADRVIDVHVGDRVEGVYEFESATDVELIFNYLPLNIRQTLPTGAHP